MSAGRVPSSPASAGGAPTTSKYLLQVADAALPNAQALGALATGLLKSTTATGVVSIAAANTDFMAALAGSGIAKVAAGVPALASAGVDFAKGPWKLFSTVRNGAPAQTLSIPVTDGENNGLIRATGRILSDGTDRNITVKINGSATNVQMRVTTNLSQFNTLVGNTGTLLSYFLLLMHTAKTANALKRAGIFVQIVFTATPAVANVNTAGFSFNDSTTTITSIDLDCGSATGLAANTEACVEEGIAG